MAKEASLKRGNLATNEDEKKYRTEVYISEIRIGKENSCEVKLKPTDDFVVKVSETNQELMTLIDSRVWDECEMDIKKGKKEVLGKFFGVNRYFTFAEEGNAAIVSYDLMLSLKQQHIKVQVCFNAKDEILWLVAK